VISEGGTPLPDVTELVDKIAQGLIHVDSSASAIVFRVLPRGYHARSQPGTRDRRIVPELAAVDPSVRRSGLPKSSIIGVQKDIFDIDKFHRNPLLGETITI
jgi:hypothetical protein